MRFNRLIPAAAIVLASGAALAAGPGDAPKQGGEDSTVLRGPKVTQNEGGQTERQTERERSGDAERADRPAPFMAHIAAIRLLSRDEALRPTPEQAQQIRTLVQERTAELQAFAEENKEQIAALREQAGLPDREGPRADRQGRPGEEDRPQGERRQRRERVQPENEMGEPEPPRGREPGGTTTGGDPAREQAPEPTPEQAAAREKLRALMETAVDDKAYTERFHAILTDAQKTALVAAVKEGRERMQQRREQGQQPERRGRLRGRDGGEGGEGPQRIQRRERPNRPARDD